VKRFLRLSGAFILGWAITIGVKLFFADVIAVAVFGIARLTGAVLDIALPYRTITVLAGLGALAVLVVLDAGQCHRTKHRSR
jgi:hypothetical protein